MDGSSGPRYTRIWADEKGVSHLEDIELPTRVVGAEPGVPVLRVADAGEAGRLQIVDIEPGSDPDWHTAPRVQFVVFLTGWVRIEAADGEHRTLPAGSVVLAEDVHGKGHMTTHEPGPQRVLVIPRQANGY